MKKSEGRISETMPDVVLGRGRLMLQVRDLETAYGRSQVLFKVSLEIGKGEVVTLLGRNGMGKTTTVRSIMGIARPRAGTVSIDDRAIQHLPSYKIAQQGLGLVPEGRQVFPNLTVRENLVATAANRSGSTEPWTLARIFKLFPNLENRKANYGNQLSGGEQQMLAIGRALMTNPRLLILDEATEGLAPLVRVEIYKSIEELKRAGLSILIIDKDVKALTRVADRHYVLEKGRVVWSGDSTQLAGSPDVQHRYLGV
jgi:branched-chain amino acid transport system ATP-binding protein